jgi:hypothetical protein
VKRKRGQARSTRTFLIRFVDQGHEQKPMCGQISEPTSSDGWWVTFEDAESFWAAVQARLAFDAEKQHISLKQTRKE